MQHVNYLFTLHAHDHDWFLEEPLDETSNSVCLLFYPLEPRTMMNYIMKEYRLPGGNVM